MLITDQDSVSAKICPVFQHVVIAVVVIRAVELLAGKEAVFEILTGTSGVLAFDRHGGAGIGRMIGATCLKSPEDVEACIHHEHSPDTHAGIADVNRVSSSKQWAVQG